MTRLDEIRARLKAATPGEWKVGANPNCDDEPIDILYRYDDHRSPNYLSLTESFRQSDADLIAHAPSDLDFLLSELDRQAKELGDAKHWQLKLEHRAQDVTAKFAASQTHVAMLRAALEWIDGPHDSQAGEDYTGLELEMVKRAAKALSETQAPPLVEGVRMLLGVLMPCEQTRDGLYTYHSSECRRCKALCDPAVRDLLRALGLGEGK